MVEIIRALPQESKETKKAEFLQLHMEGSDEVMQEMVRTWTLEQQIELFALFESVDEFLTWHKQIPAERKAHYYQFYTKEFLKMSGVAWQTVFGTGNNEAVLKH